MVIIYMWNLTYGTNEPTYKTEKKTHRHRDQNCVCQGRREAEDRLGIWGWQVQTVTSGMDKQGPPAQHRDIYPVFWDKP